MIPRGPEASLQRYDGQLESEGSLEKNPKGLPKLSFLPGEGGTAGTIRVTCADPSPPMSYLQRSQHGSAETHPARHAARSGESHPPPFHRTHPKGGQVSGCSAPAQ